MGVLRNACLGLFALALGACSAVHPPDSGNGETHFLFLEHCASDDDCGADLRCACGACTRVCTADDGCSALSSGASCEAAASAGGSCARELGPRVCAQRCDNDDDCDGFGAKACREGACSVAVGTPRLDAGASEDAGRAGSGGAPASDAAMAEPDGSTPVVPQRDAGSAVGEDCALPADPGPCFAIMPRFHHDPVSHTCASFTYGGCQGNANNFATRTECEQACDVSPTPPCEIEADDPALPGVRVRITSDRCRMPSGEAQLFNYSVAVDAPIAYDAPDSGGSCGRCSGYSDEPLSLVDSSIGAGGVNYCQCDVGCCAPTVAHSVTLKTGTFSGFIDWPGRQWSGPSDTGQPFGPPFPPGSYQVGVSFTVPGVGAVHAQLPIEVL